MAASPRASIAVGERTIEVSNPDRVLFPAAGLTKGDLARYYAAVAPTMVAHVADRPMTIVRYPKGLDGEGFFQKNAPAHYPAWIRRVELPKRGGVVTHPVVDDPAALVYLAQQGMITPHIGLARTANQAIGPDLFVVDLDPSVEDLAQLVRVAHGVRGALTEAGLVPFVQLTGSKGVHIVAPVTGATWGDVGRFAGALATLLVDRFRDDVTQAFAKAERGDRIYLDLARNGAAATFVAPYGVRALPTAPVAAPIDWAELDDPDLSPGRHTVTSMPARLARLGDPWAALAASARPLPG